jgi:RNA polymerase sigma factor (TIGR02999 family)
LLRQCLQTEANYRPNDMATVRASLQETRRAGRRRSSVRIRALAVLPLTNLSRDPEQKYFADGMTEALIAALAPVSAIRVISRTSAMHYKGTTKTVPEIARELGVDGIIEGSVMRAGERVRITAQLVHAATDRHLWAHTYERDLRDVLHLQGEVARAVADEIQVMLTPQERARFARTRPVNVEAHEAYIRGRYDWGRAHLHRSIEHFERAVAIDPDYALAHAGIADPQCRMFGAAMEMVPPTQAAQYARAAALKALELDDSLSEPHVSLSRVLLWYDRDPIGAEREVRRAIQLDSNSAMAHFIYSLVDLVYPTLRRIARGHLARRRAGESIESAALTNEAYLKLVRAGGIRCENRAHFLALCAQVMRRILVDHVRRRGYAKRGGDAVRVAIDDAVVTADTPGIDVVELDEALHRLAAIDSRKSRVVELRYFGGLNLEETAETLAVSVETVKRDWRMARAWLRSELSR